ncbi:Ctr copper transporter family-domain-containing protein [Limtongia smithiae]|uniref:Ctr copper transporter family-domain-containing protein n=1 Tax=Limtongia smithiae TaxID=1125753 RepID=UPI0034CF1426
MSSTTWSPWRAAALAVESTTDAFDNTTTAVVEHGTAASQCNMNMLFTWQTQDICIVFNWWHIYNRVTLAFSFLGIVGLAIVFEFIREFTRRYESYINSAARNEEILPLVFRHYIPDRSVRDRLVLSLLYAIQILISYFLMLVFMSYSGMMMFAVVVGAFFGYFFFGSRARLHYTAEATMDHTTEIEDDDVISTIQNEKESFRSIMSKHVGVTAVRGGTCH